MRRRRDHSSAIALCASALVHAGVLYLCSEVATDELQTLRHYPPLPALALTQESRIYIDIPTPPAPPKPAPIVPPESEPPAIPPDQAKPLAIIPPALLPPPPPSPPPAVSFGEASGNDAGKPYHSAPGDELQMARKAERDQPYTSRDPAGRPTPTPPSTPAQADAGDQTKAGDPGEAGKPADPKPVPLPPPSAEATVAARQPEVKPLIPLPNSTPDPISLGAASPKPDQAISPPPTSQQPPAPTLAMAQPKPLPITAAPATAAAPSSPTTPAGSPEAAKQANSSADPAPQTDSESDAFSTTGSVIFRPGRVTARFGRKVKTVRPRISLAGHYDLYTSGTSVVLKVRTEETGNVREVIIMRSSGSPTIDQACKLAMYEWWFEPLRDKNGRQFPAELVWTISFVGS